MNFAETNIPGVFLIEPDRIEDERGFFARTWCEDEFRTQGLNPRMVQCSISFNRKRGTLRGMHYQAAPQAETKLVRCTMGAIYDVLIDLRPESTSYRRWLAVDLSAESRRMLYIPGGLAHGFQTLVDNTEVFYQMSEFYHPECARGVRWNDPEFGIQWPIPVSVIAEKDNAYPLWGTAQ